MKVYCDTSALVALASQEPTWTGYAGWLGNHASLIMLSSFGWGELADGAARRIRRGEVAIGQSDAWFASARHVFAGWHHAQLTNADVTEATRCIGDSPLRALKLPDAIHLAICRRLNATLLTGDRQQAAAAADLDIAHHLILASTET